MHDSKGVATERIGAGSSVNGTDSTDAGQGNLHRHEEQRYRGLHRRLQLGGNQTAINTLSNCATDTAHFYNSTTGDALKAAFRDIALKISTLYLAQ